MLFAGIASSLFAAYCWMRGLACMGAERTSVFMNLMPLCTALIAVISLGNPFTAITCWGWSHPGRGHALPVQTEGPPGPTGRGLSGKQHRILNSNGNKRERKLP